MGVRFFFTCDTAEKAAYTHSCSLVSFLVALSCLFFTQTTLVTRLCVGLFLLPVALLTVWCIWISWESEQPNPLFALIRRGWSLLTIRNIQESESESDMTTEKDSSICVSLEKGPAEKTSWTMAAVLRRFSGDSQATVVV